MPEDTAFWMVWNPARSAPTARHDSERSAVLEAERLARANPGEQFYVLVAIHLRQMDAMKRVRLEAELPF